MTEFTHYRVHTDHQIAEMDGPGMGNEARNSGKFIQNMLQNMKVNILRRDKESIDFELIGIDASLANALRRIMLSEVPTVAIENVWISVNTSIIQDEVLAHRIGLIPINADPSSLEELVNEEETDKDTIVFHLDVECTDERVPKPFGRAGTCFKNEQVLSSALTWLPQGEQLEVFQDGVAPVHGDIVLAQLRPGQRIEFEAHCRRGVGKDHTKFSPVATASYRLLPGENSLCNQI
jgi:DNA-directed RNA polymerase I and III subunit RPAC1